MALEYFLYTTEYNNTLIERSNNTFAPLPPNTGEIYIDYMIPEIQPLYLFRESGGTIVLNDETTVNDYIQEISPPPTTEDSVTYGAFTGYTATTAMLYIDSEDPTGFVEGSSINVSYDYTGRTITLTGDLSYYWHGVKKTLTSPWTSSAHDAIEGNWFLSTTDGENFTWAQTPWIFADIQVAFVYYTNDINTTFAIRETHGLLQHDAHQTLHQTIGTYRVSGGQAIDGTYAFNTATDAATTPNFAVAVVRDEDVDSTIPQVDAGQYTRMYISGDTSIYSFAQAFPFYDAGSYIQVNNTLTGTLTNGINNRWYNVYQILVPVTSDAPSQKFRMIWLQPQQTYTSLVAAQGEDVRGLRLGELTAASAEYVIYARITYETGVSNSNAGKVRIPVDGITYVVGNKMSQVSVAGTSASNHANLGNLNWNDSGHISDVDSLAAFNGTGTAVAIPKTTYTESGVTTQLQSDLNTHSGNTDIHFIMSDLTGFTTTTDFNTYTGDTATALDTKASKLVTINSITATTYTTVDADSNEIIECASGCTGVTFHSGSSVGFQVTIVNAGGQTITFSAQSGSTLNTKDDAVTLTNKWGAVSFYKRNTTEWVGIGDIE